MPIEPDQVETITFDSFTTIVGVMTTTSRELGKYIEDGETVSDVASLWRFRAVEYRMLSNYLDTYETYYETTCDALKYALAVHDVNLTDTEIENVVSQFHKLDVFNDVYENVQVLHDMGYDMYIVSNGTPELLHSMVSRANIESFIVDTISADDVKTYKPAVEFYQHTAEQTDTSLENIVHIAAPWYDIYGANNAGLQTVWVNRSDRPWETFDGSPDKTISTLCELPPIFE